MRLLFEQSCTCRLPTDQLPKPTIHYGSPPDMRDAKPSGAIDVGFACANCGTPWKGSLLADLGTGQALRKLRKLAEKSN